MGGNGIRGSRFPRLELTYSISLLQGSGLVIRSGQQEL